MTIIQMMPVSWIMQNVTESVDIYSTPADLWRDMIKSKSYDSVILTLSDIVHEKGCFDDPICITRRGRSWCMGNGHHRMTTAILCALDEIPVALDLEDGDYMLSHITSPYDSNQELSQRWTDQRDTISKDSKWLYDTIDFGERD